VSRLTAVTIVLLVLGTVGIGSVASQTSGYTISASPSVDTPTREVTFDNQEFTVSATARVDPGETVAVTVSSPSGHFYSIPLYDSDQRIVDKRDGTNDSTVSFETAFEDGGTYAPGTYAITVSHDGIFQVVHPLVVAGYRVAVTAPANGEAGADVTVEASLSTIDGSKAISDVTLVIGNDDRDRRVTMTETGSDAYSTTVELDQLGPGEYTLYVVVQGEEEALGKQEVLGLSDAQSFSITDGTPTSTSDDDDGGGQDDSSDDGTATADGTTTERSSTTDDGTDSGTATGSETTAVTSTTTEVTTSDSSVITPRTTVPTGTRSPTSSPGQPLGLLSAVVALVAVGWLARRRAR
jgi:GH43 family beta-xylosidase